MGELLLRQIKGGCSCLMGVQFPIPFYIYFGTLITGRLMDVQLYIYITLIKRAFTYTGTYLLVFLQEIPVTGPGWGRYTKV